MKRSRLYALPRTLLTGSLVLLAMRLGGGEALAAGTIAGQAINNTATASYQDGSGTAYTTNSNQVTTTVQNAPSFTDTPPAAPQTLPPGGQATDSFVLANTGNASAIFSIPSVTSTASAGASPTINSYTLTNGASVTSGLTLAQLQTALSTTSVATGSSITIGVVYTVATNATVGSTISTTLTNVTATQAAVGAAAAVTSAAASGTATDNTAADARLDLAIAQVQSNSTGAITYTVTANNGGSFASKDLAVVKALLGSPATGDFVVDKVPTGATFPAASPGVAVSTTGLVAGAAFSVYTTTDATGQTGWTLLASPATATIPAGTTYIGVLLSGGASGTEFAPLPANSQTALAATGRVTTPALTFSYTVAQPTSGSYTNVANSLIGSNAATEAVVGPTINTIVADSASGAPSAALTAAYGAVTNTTAANTPSGSSNQVSVTPLGVLNGPFGVAGAIGSYDGVSAVNNSDDFFVVGLAPGSFTSVNSGTVAGTPSGNATTATISGYAHNTVQNTASTTQTATLTASVPGAGWHYQFFNDTAGAVGTSLAALDTAATQSLTAGQIFNYYVQYTSPTGITSFQRYDSVVTATIGTATNTVHNELYEGFVVMTKTALVTANNCPAGTTVAPGGAAFTYPVAGVCPGGTIQYTVDYRSAVPAGGTGNTEPAAATAAVTTKAGTLVITEDGTGTGAFGTAAANNWATYTNGVTAAGVAATYNGSADAATTYQYFTGPTGATAAGGPTGATKFQATIGGAAFTLAPGTGGTLVFSVVVK